MTAIESEGVEPEGNGQAAPSAYSLTASPEAATRERREGGGRSSSALASPALTGEIESSLAGRMMRGMAAGCVATAPMTVAMYAVEALLPREDRLPSLKEPALISRRVFAAADVRDDMSRDQEEALIWLGHFAYGATCGAIYGAAVDGPARRSLVSGAVLGLTVWGLSYAGWLPAAGLLRFPTRRPADRSAELILSHLVWGVGTVVALKMMESERSG